MRQGPSPIVVGVGVGVVAVLTVSLVRRLTASPPPGQTGSVMAVARNNQTLLDTIWTALGWNTPAPECANGCGRPLDFVAGVARCPNGSDRGRHPTGPFFHLDCLTEDGACPACRFMLRGDDRDRYLVHNARTVPPRPAETWSAVVTATRWSQAYRVRQRGMLCHAASAQAVWRAFNRPKTQLECAHDWAFSSGADGYYPVYRARFNEVRDEKPTEGSVPQVQARMETDQGSAAAIEQLIRQFGEPILTGIGAGVLKKDGIEFTGTNGIRDAIDTNKLIMAGSSNHWVVIYGYQTSTRDGQRVIFYDALSADLSKTDNFPSFAGTYTEFWIVG